MDLINDITYSESNSEEAKASAIRYAKQCKEVADEAAIAAEVIRTNATIKPIEYEEDAYYKAVYRGKTGIVRYRDGGFYLTGESREFSASEFDSINPNKIEL